MSDALMSLALEELGEIGQLNHEDKKALQDIFSFSPITSKRLMNAVNLQDEPEKSTNILDLSAPTNIELNTSKHYLNDTVDGSTGSHNYPKLKKEHGIRQASGLSPEIRTPTTMAQIPSYMQQTVSGSLGEAKRYNHLASSDPGQISSDT